MECKKNRKSQTLKIPSNPLSQSRLPKIPVSQKMKIKSISYLLFLFPLILLGNVNEPSEPRIPKVAEISGQVNRFNEKTGFFQPVEPGARMSSPTLIVTGEGSELYLSFPGRIAARVGESSRVVVGPAVDGLYIVDLRLGTVSARLDPERDRGQGARLCHSHQGRSHPRRRGLILQLPSTMDKVMQRSKKGR